MRNQFSCHPFSVTDGYLENHPNNRNIPYVKQSLSVYFQVHRLSAEDFTVFIIFIIQDEQIHQYPNASKLWKTEESNTVLYGM